MNTENLNSNNEVNTSSGSDFEPSSNQVEEKRSKKKKRGFACIDPERVREIAAKGGRAAHALGKAHKWTLEEARCNGRKGGLAEHRVRGRQGQAAKLPFQE